MLNVDIVEGKVRKEGHPITSLLTLPWVSSGEYWVYYEPGEYYYHGGEEPGKAKDIVEWKLN